MTSTVNTIKHVQRNLLVSTNLFLYIKAFISNNNDIAVVSDLDDAQSNASVSDTSKTKKDKMDCSDVPEKGIIPLSSINYLLSIQKLKIELSKMKKIPLSSKKKK